MSNQENEETKKSGFLNTVGSWASFCGKGISSATLLVVGTKDTVRRQGFNFCARGVYRVTNLATNIVIDGGKVVVGQRGDKRYPFFANAWDGFWGNLGRRKTLERARQNLLENPPANNEIYDVPVESFAPEFEKPQNRVLNTAFNFISIAGIPAGLFFTTKWAVIKPSVRTFTLATKSWGQASTMVFPKLKSIGLDFKDGFVHTANLVTGNFDKIPSTSRNGKMADCVRERAEGSKMLFMKEVSDLGYNVPEEYLFKKTAADHVAEKASWIEKAIDYKPQEKKVGPFKFKW